jgi:hypothetical protein
VLARTENVTAVIVKIDDIIVTFKCFSHLPRRKSAHAKPYKKTRIIKPQRAVLRESWEVADPLAA